MIFIEIILIMYIYIISVIKYNMGARQTGVRCVFGIYSFIIMILPIEFLVIRYINFIIYPSRRQSAVANLGPSRATLSHSILSYAYIRRFYLF